MDMCKQSQTSIYVKNPKGKNQESDFTIMSENYNEFSRVMLRL